MISLVFVVFRDRLFAEHHTDSFRNLFPVGRLICPHHHLVVCKLNDGVTGVGGSTACGVESVKHCAQHTPLWGARAQCPGAVEVVSQFDCLGLVCEEVLNPRAGEWGESQIRQLADQDVRDDSVEC